MIHCHLRETVISSQNWQWYFTLELNRKKFHWQFLFLFYICLTEWIRYSIFVVPQRNENDSFCSLSEKTMYLLIHQYFTFSHNSSNHVLSKAATEKQHKIIRNISLTKSNIRFILTKITDHLYPLFQLVS